MISTPIDTIRVSAPARLDFAGGWTDVAPFATEATGIVVNAAITLRTRVELVLNTGRYQIASADHGEDTADHIDGFANDGKLALLKAVLRASTLGPCTLHAAADAPAGSGLGTSGTLGVALVHAVDVAVGRSPALPDVAETAWRLETVDAGVAGGKQDQYAAAIAGFQRLQFDRSGTASECINLDGDFARWLGDHIVLCHTGASRVSSATIARVMRGYEQRSPTIVGALHELARLGDAMADALTAGDPAEVARLLLANWHQQQLLDSSI